MAENRNITWNVKLVIKPAVTQRFTLSQTANSLQHGKWGTAPPSQIIADANGEKSVSFKAMGAACSATGTQGSVSFAASDNIHSPTTFTFTFDIPYSSANSGNVTISNSGNGNYEVSGGTVPVSGNSVSVDVTVTQIAPLI